MVWLIIGFQGQPGTPRSRNITSWVKTISRKLVLNPEFIQRDEVIGYYCLTKSISLTLVHSGVMPPDEYNYNVNNSVYTNSVAKLGYLY